MKRIILILAIVCLSNGCVAALIGTGVVAGYSLSTDSATGNIKVEYRHLWDISLDKLEEMHAEIIDTNESKGIIKANVSDHSVTIKINTVGKDVQNLRVSARKTMLPKPQFAQKIFLKITQRLSSD